VELIVFVLLLLDLFVDAFDVEAFGDTSHEAYISILA